MTILKCAYVVIVYSNIDVPGNAVSSYELEWPAVSTFDRIEHLIHKSIGVTMGNMPLRDTGQGNRQVVVSYYNPQMSYRWLQNFGSLGNQKLASF